MVAHSTTKHLPERSQGGHFYAYQAKEHLVDDHILRVSRVVARNKLAGTHSNSAGKHQSNQKITKLNAGVPLQNTICNPIYN